MDTNTQNPSRRLTLDELLEQNGGPVTDVEKFTEIQIHDAVARSCYEHDPKECVLAMRKLSLYPIVKEGEYHFYTTNPYLYAEVVLGTDFEELEPEVQEQIRTEKISSKEIFSPETNNTLIGLIAEKISRGREDGGDYFIGIMERAVTASDVPAPHGKISDAAAIQERTISGPHSMKGRIIPWNEGVKPNVESTQVYDNSAFKRIKPEAVSESGGVGVVSGGVVSGGVVIDKTNGEDEKMNPMTDSADSTGNNDEKYKLTAPTDIPAPAVDYSATNISRKEAMNLIKDAAAELRKSRSSAIDDSAIDELVGVAPIDSEAVPGDIPESVAAPTTYIAPDSAPAVAPIETPTTHPDLPVAGTSAAEPPAAEFIVNDIPVNIPQSPTTEPEPERVITPPPIPYAKRNGNRSEVTPAYGTPFFRARQPTDTNGVSDKPKTTPLDEIITAPAGEEAATEQPEERRTTSTGLGLAPEEREFMNSSPAEDTPTEDTLEAAMKTSHWYNRMYGTVKSGLGNKTLKITALAVLIAGGLGTAVYTYRNEIGNLINKYYDSTDYKPAAAESPVIVPAAASVIAAAAVSRDAGTLVDDCLLDFVVSSGTKFPEECSGYVSLFIDNLTQDAPVAAQPIVQPKTQQIVQPQEASENKDAYRKMKTLFGSCNRGAAPQLPACDKTAEVKELVQLVKNYVLASAGEIMIPAADGRGIINCHTALDNLYNGLISNSQKDETEAVVRSYFQRTMNYVLCRYLISGDTHLRIKIKK